MFTTDLMTTNYKQPMVYIGALVFLTIMALITWLLGQWMLHLPENVTHYY